MKIILFDGGGGHQRWFAPLAKHLRHRGNSVELCYGARRRKRLPDPNEYDRAVIWNGCRDVDRQFAGQCREKGVHVCFIEVGFFSQQTHFILSRNGSVGGDLFIGEDIPDLPLNGEEFLSKEFARYSKGRSYVGGGDYIAGFLQLPGDMSIRRHSRFPGMQDYILEVESLYPEIDVIFKPHPKDRRPKVRTRCALYRQGSIWPHIIKANRVVGINSTTLYEAAFAGAPVVALGNCPLSRHPTKHREIVHEILMRQLPVGSPLSDEKIHRSIGDFFG